MVISFAAYDELLLQLIISCILRKILIIDDILYENMGVLYRT